MQNPESLKEKCQEIRRAIIETAFRAQKGHLPSAFSIVEILVLLYYRIAKVDRSLDPNRDRIILSKGHGCLALYAILADLEFFPRSELDHFCTPKGLLGGHPSAKVPGIEVSTGSLGHGPAIGVGMALAAVMNGLSSQVFVIVGDGECDEGSVWEAALGANKHRLSNFWIIVDCNQYQSYDKVESVCPLGDLRAKWRSFGFDCAEVDMLESPLQLVETVERLRNTIGPKCILCRTIKGMGAPSLEGNLAFHHIRTMSVELRDQLLAEVSRHA